MRPPSRHAAFFSSLKQVEKRLASETSGSSCNRNPSENRLFSSTTAATESSSSPIFLNYHQPNNDDDSPGLQESDPPQDFLSHSIDFPPSPKNPSQSDPAKCNPTAAAAAAADNDEIARLIDLLGLYDKEGELKKRMSCFCDGGFYSKIAGVKGPKCEKESERLEGWIGYFLKDGGGERREPLRLAHLLLAKAACACLDDGFGEIEFPSTVDEYLNNNPPT